MTGATRAGEPVREAFCELLGADPDWVRAEFEALVAANWRGGGAQGATGSVDAPGPRPGRPVPRARRSAPLRRGRAPERRAPRRERSPPAG
ncbi:hypothetical protein [Kineococcus arenarius]|uniref:hypothetical protein n=1 Tax=Kineococcus sp. SYSU DK007 TaxID=3383128 RepID=UPI003D7C47EE